VISRQCRGSRFTRNNGITEGFHNKMELINRQAYGLRNIENYRLRVKALSLAPRAI
jgi:transposase